MKNAIDAETNFMAQKLEFVSLGVCILFALILPVYTMPASGEHTMCEIVFVSICGCVLLLLLLGIAELLLWILKIIFKKFPYFIYFSWNSDWEHEHVALYFF